MMEYGRVWTEADEWEYQDFDSLYRNADDYNRYGEPPDEPVELCSACGNELEYGFCEDCFQEFGR